MSVQEYEATLDPNYLADQRWEKDGLLQENEDWRRDDEELQHENDQLWAEQNQ